MPGYYKRTKQQLEKLMTELPTYKKSPYAGMQLGAANNILNSAMPGQAQFGRNILSSQGSSLDFIGKNATDASQALSLAAGAGARTDQQFADQSSQYADWKKFGLGNLNDAYAANMNEDRYAYEKESETFGNKVQLQGAIAANDLAKRKALWSTVGQIGQLAVGAFTGGASSAASGIGKMFGGAGASSAAGAVPGMGALATALSDIRMKENYFVVGKSKSGINIYEFSYKGNAKRYIGVMAQEVPYASINLNGVLYVDYSKIDVEFKEI